MHTVYFKRFVMPEMEITPKNINLADFVTVQSRMIEISFYLRTDVG
jgi:hypothetical protein